LPGGGTTIALRAQVGTLQERITVSADSPGSAQRSTQSATPRAAKECVPSATGGQLIPPMKIRDVRPRYKQEWRDNRIEGEILMTATIGTDGRVRGVDVISPVNAELEDEAMAAVAQWAFTPTYLNCEPVEVQMHVTVAFKLP
jgi:TonB family protein